MTDEEITTLLGQPESDRLERKAALSGERVKIEIAQAICAFSNSIPTTTRTAWASSDPTAA